MNVKTKIAEIEGIGPAYAAKLAKAGVESVESLLTKGRTPDARKQIAAASGCSEQQILHWVNMADLFRIQGIGSQYAELLEASGVDTVKELRTRVPSNLVAAMTKVNADKHLVRSLPTSAHVTAWIDHAKTLPPAVEY